MVQVSSGDSPLVARKELWLFHEERGYQRTWMFDLGARKWEMPVTTSAREAFAQRQHVHLALEPLVKLALPVGHQAGGGHHDGTPSHGLPGALKARAQQRPEQRDGLQGLP